MRKNVFLITVLVFVVIGLIACGNGDKQAMDNQPDGTDIAGLEWPSEYMSIIPVPDSKISSIEKLDGTEAIAEGDTETQPSSVNVVMNEMTKDEALAYYDKLKDSGFTINTDQKDNDKILLVGGLNDAGENLFLFSYLMEDNFGNVSITIIDALY